MEITWSIIQLDYALSEGEHSNVVNHSHWQCIAEDADGNQGRVYNSIEIPTDDLSSFTPYADITEAQAIQWTKDALGSDTVAEMEARAAEELQIVKNPTEGSGTPWSS